MWNDFNINNEKYFIKCNFKEDQVFCVLYDGSKSGWSEIQQSAEIVKRVKELNKRFMYDEKMISEVLQTNTPVEATFTKIEPEEDEEKKQENSFKLKLKYRVQSLPFHFEWKLKEQTASEFQETIFAPFFKIFVGVTKQNDELREIIRKKDVELKQFKIEGAELQRSTLVTKPFNPVEFDRKFVDSTELTKSYIRIAEHLKDKFSEGETNSEKPETSKSSTLKAEMNSKNPRNAIKLSPRKKRRKAMEQKQRLLVEKMKTAQKGLQYESQSQSLSQSSSNSQDSDEETKAVKTNAIGSNTKKSNGDDEEEEDEADAEDSQDVKDILSELKILQEKSAADLKNRK